MFQPSQSNAFHPSMYATVHSLSLMSYPYQKPSYTSSFLSYPSWTHRVLSSSTCPVLMFMLGATGHVQFDACVKIVRTKLFCSVKNSQVIPWPVYGSRKVLLDGLLVCDAAPCHSMVAKMAGVQGQLTPGQVNMWLSGLHLHSSVSPSLVTELLVSPLVLILPSSTQPDALSSVSSYYYQHLIFSIL